MCQYVETELFLQQVFRTRIPDVLSLFQKALCLWNHFLQALITAFEDTRHTSIVFNDSARGLLNLQHEICQRTSLSFFWMKENWKAIRSTSQLWCPMDGFFSRAWLNSTYTNGESLNELDLHMILISFLTLKASINCLKESIQPVLMLCESLNDVLTRRWFIADKEIEWKRNTQTQHRSSCSQQS